MELRSWRSRLRFRVIGFVKGIDNTVTKTDDRNADVDRTHGSRHVEKNFSGRNNDVSAVGLELKRSHSFLGGERMKGFVERTQFVDSQYALFVFFPVRR